MKQEIYVSKAINRKRERHGQARDSNDRQERRGFGQSIGKGQAGNRLTL